MTDEKERSESEVGTEEAPPAGSDEGPTDRAPVPDAESPSDATGTGEVAEEMEALRAELEELNDRHLRLAAEFDNYRKRNQRDRNAMATRLQAELITALLDVLDDLQRVEESGVGAEAESVLEGVRLVEKKFMGVLEGAGLEPVDAVGKAFDPEQMEALAGVPTEDPEQDHRVADVFQRGYRFRDTLIRPARVRVWQFEEQDSE